MATTPIETSSSSNTLASVPSSLASSRYTIFMKDLIAGGMAGAISRTSVSPLERIKILFQIQVPDNIQFRGIFGTLRRIWMEEGWIGYFKGNGTNIVRIVPYSAVQFASYETYKKLLLNERQHLSVPQTLAAGAGAGITSVTATYPLDIIRTRLSLSEALTAPKGSLAIHEPSFSTLATINEPANVSISKIDLINKSRILSCGYKIIKDEGGWTSLYRGLLPTILGIAPYVALNFTTYETLKRHIATLTQRDPTIHEKLFCGGTAGAVAQSATYPLDVLRRRLQVHGSPNSLYHYNGMWNAISSIFRNEGWKTFYRGMLPNLLKVIPSMSVSFVTYELAQKYLLS